MEDWTAAADVLMLASQLVEEIQDALARRGFPDSRPAYGFAFVRIGAGGATIADLAAHLGITKQAAAQLARQLEERGYVTRRPHPHDARATLLALTERGTACTWAAEEASAEAVGR
jgi:DNA-binding MarR family transcriptional regulator